MNKKGDGETQVYIMLFYVGLALAIGAILILFFLDLKDDSYYRMKATSVDIALIQEMMQASPTPIKITLKSTDDFIVEFIENPCTIKVSRPDGFSSINYKCYNKELYLPNDQNKIILSKDEEFVFEKK